MEAAEEKFRLGANHLRRISSRNRCSSKQVWVWISSSWSSETPGGTFAWVPNFFKHPLFLSEGLQEERREKIMLTCLWIHYLSSKNIPFQMKSPSELYQLKHVTYGLFALHCLIFGFSSLFYLGKLFFVWGILK